MNYNSLHSHAQHNKPLFWRLISVVHEQEAVVSELEADTFLAGSFVTMTSLKLSVQNVGFGSDVRCRSLNSPYLVKSGIYA